MAGVGIAPAVEEVRRVFDWAESVVCAALSYLPPEEPCPDASPRGVVARLARGADYHVVLREKLEQLAETIRQQHPAARLEVCVDTVPLPERKLAVLSGIAWRGKNGCVFVDGCGSWVALGEIVTNLPLEAAGEHAHSRCGDCTRCIEACPTRAIVAPHEIDCSRCLSALTQSPGPISAALRRAVGNRIYGCDTCQEVCPQNAGIIAVTPEFSARRFPGAHPELIPLMEMTSLDYNKIVKDSPIGWIRRTRIRRNAIIAAGSVKCREAVPTLSTALTDPSPALREAAAWAIKEIRGDLSKKE